DEYRNGIKLPGKWYWTVSGCRPIVEAIPHGAQVDKSAGQETSRMQKFTIRIENTGEHYACTDKRSVLEGMVALGKKGIPVGCRQGGCGVCKVRVLEGQYVRRVMSRAHVSAEEEQDGCVLSCRI